MAQFPRANTRLNLYKINRLLYIKLHNKDKSIILNVVVIRHIYVNIRYLI